MQSGELLVDFMKLQNILNFEVQKAIDSIKAQNLRLNPQTEPLTALGQVGEVNIKVNNDINLLNE